jgi:predicted TIM-barrel fold metal-dependent hydrolase
MMVSRRDILAGASAASVLMIAHDVFGKAVQSVTKVNFAMPSGACDCHTHIHGDTKVFPWFAGRVYTPELALPAEMATIHRALGIQRVVIVTPSVYGTDNTATLWGMKARGADARGGAVIDGKTTESELDTMHMLGVRGIRLNITTGGTGDPAVARRWLQDAVSRMQRRNWHVQLNTRPEMIAAMKDVIAASPVPVVFDDFGGARPELGVQQPGFAEMTELVRTGKAYVKISVGGGPRTDYSGFAPLARALIAANPDRIVWGTNWPHPNSAGGSAERVTPLFPVDNGLVLNQLPSWTPDAGTRKKILVDNPARLYAFA